LPFLKGQPDKVFGGCKTGFGFGFQGGADAAFGVIYAGAAATGGIGGGLFFGGDSKMTAGAYRSNGATAYAGSSHVAGNPAQTMGSPTVVLGGVSGGGGVFVTNATSASQLQGPFSTMAGSASFGQVGLAVQISNGTDGSGNNIWQVSVSYAPGYGIGGYNLTTNTKAVTTGPTCP